MGSKPGSKPIKVACLLGEGFEDSELRIPYDRLREAGFAVEIIGQRAGEELKGYRGRETVKADRGIDDANVDEYAALLIPGGYSPDHLRADARFVEFVRAFDATGRTVAAVCHGPQLLITAGLVSGRTMTAWKTIQDDLRQIGADVKDEPVVTDGNWITSRQPDDLEAFSQAILQTLRQGAEHGSQEKSEEEAEEDAEQEMTRQRAINSSAEQPQMSAEAPPSDSPESQAQGQDTQSRR
jgi:protease I